MWRSIPEPGTSRENNLSAESLIDQLVSCTAGHPENAEREEQGDPHNPNQQGHDPNPIVDTPNVIVMKAGTKEEKQKEKKFNNKQPRLLTVLSSSKPSTVLCSTKNEVKLPLTAEMTEEAPLRRLQMPAASTTQVPTMSTVHSVKRILSYSDKLPVEDQTANPEALPAAVKSDKKEQDHRNSENMVKAALTELLNDEDVKNNPNSNKSVQNLLMKTEIEWRRQRRKSVHERSPDQTRK